MSASKAGKLVAATETQPLLTPGVPTTPAYDSSAELEDPIATQERAEVEAAAALPEVDKKATTATIVWRVILGIFIALGIAIVVKAFVDSDNPDVSPPPCEGRL